MQNKQLSVIVLLLFLVTAGLQAGSAWGQQSASEPGFQVPYFEPPHHLDFCGEPVPLHNQDVWERFDREFTIVVYSHAQVYLWLKRMERFLPWIEKRLKAEGLPDDLKYVAIAESDLLLYAQSPKAAAGPWQFIPGTGKRFGLDQSTNYDERFDFEAATDGAIRYLKVLYGIFSNWTLSVAAYNCGEDRVSRELQQQKVRDYYSLKLPLETERYILRILAIKAVLSNPQRYGYRLPAGAGYPELTLDRVQVSLGRPLSVQEAADAAGITYREFKQLNRAFTGRTMPAGTYIVKLPAGKGEAFKGKVKQIAARQQPMVVYHTVAKGQTLSGIAKNYKVSVKDLRRWNNLKGHILTPGQRLRILK